MNASESKLCLIDCKNPSKKDVLSQVMSKRNYLFSHLANTHGVIDKYMSKGLKSHARPVAEKTKESPPPDDDAEEEQPIGESAKRERFACKHCCAIRSEYRELVVHYCLVHYKTGA